MANKRGPVGGPELLVEIERAGELPLHEQIERSLREQIRSGRLPADVRLPSTRGLAAELGVSRGVVTEAYGQLAAEGYLTTSQGAPVRVAKA
ncbi:MAG: winged helix-turn-helix domain-containing protein, partial [Solirubrobacteraceae bacterium]